MGSQTVSQSKDTLTRMFWQERPVKWTISTNDDEKFHLEEVKTPWDLFIEGAIFDSEVGDTMHQTLVQNHLERIFSVRNEDGLPICDIITKPEKAPLLDFKYGARRVFNTSSPMTIDGEKLIVLDVVGIKGSRVKGPVLQLAKAIFLGNGGRLDEEHPNGLIYSEKKDIKHWRRIVESEVLLDLIISSKPLKEVDDNIKRTAWCASNLEVAKTLIDQRYWNKFHLNGDDIWAKDILDYIEADEDAAPQGIIVYGGDNARVLYERVKRFYEETE